MVSLMCGCCCSKSEIRYLPGPFVKFRFSNELNVYNGKIEQCYFQNTIELWNGFGSIFKTLYYNYCTLNADTGRKLSPPADDPDNGAWTEGFFVQENGKIYKTQDIPSIENALSLIRSFLPLDSSFRYSFFDNSKQNWISEPVPSNSSFDVVFTSFLDYARSSYNECVSKFGSSNYVCEGSFVIYHPEGVICQFLK